MAQHDFTIDNQGFPAFRSDLNNVLSAIASNSSGATEPTTTFAYQWWYDTTTDILKMRNADDDAWITIGTFNQTTDTFTLSDVVAASGDTMTGALNFGDSVKAQFGAGNDLQIYHDGSNSYIEDAGTGELVLKSNGASVLMQSGTEYFLRAYNNAQVELFHNGSTKLATTSTGVDVTGTIEATRGIGNTNTDTSNTGSVTLDFSANQNFVLTLTGNVTLANPTTEAVGQSGFIVFIQDSTGGRTVSLGTDYETAGGAGLTLSSTASTTDVVPYIVAASGRILLGAPQLAFS